MRVLTRHWPRKHAMLLALVFLGMSLSDALGLPRGAWLGLRHGRQVPIARVAGLSAAAGLALAAMVPGGTALGHGLAFAHLAWVGEPFAVLGGLTLWAGARREPGVLRA